MTTTETARRDVIIIGSGPAGYAAAIYTARARLDPLVFEGSVEAGGALMNTTEVENYPGFSEGILGPELMQEMRKQAERFGAELITDDVVDVHLEPGRHRVTDSAGTTYEARAVILATGSGYRRLDLDGEQRLSGHGVSWCATCDGFFFRDQEIAVVGGGDSAVEEATFLTRFASRVYLIHRRDTLRASTIMQERAKNDPKLEILWNSQVTELHGEKALTGVTLTDTVTGQTRELAVTGLFEAIGHDPRSALFQGQVDLDSEGYVVTTAPTTHTSMEGVFACGDLVDHRYRQAITAAGAGCSAALDAEKYLAELPVETAASTVPVSAATTSELAAVDSASFTSEVLEHDGPVLVDFWAPWCGPCKKLKPVVADVARANADRLKVVTLDIEEAPDIAQRYGVTSVPTLIVFNDGEAEHELRAARSKSALLSGLASYIA